MSKLFGRSWEIVVGTPAQGYLDLSDLAISFEVKKSLRPEPNTCEMVISNLAPATRKAITTPKALDVRILAGYGGQNALVYRGQVRTLAPGEVEGADINTQLSSGDGEKTQQTVRLNVPVGPGMKSGDVLNAIANALGVGIGNLANFVSKLNASGAAIYPRPTAITGYGWNRLLDLCRAANLEVSIQDGALLFLDLGQPLQTMPYVLGSDSGLIGSPKRDNDGRVTIETLMLPQIRCGQSVQIQSRNVTATMRVAEQTIKGDTWGDDWGMTHTLDKPGVKI